MTVTSYNILSFWTDSMLQKHSSYMHPYVTVFLVYLLWIKVFKCYLYMFFELHWFYKGFLLILFQMHPLGLCNSNDEEDLYEYGWVGVVKLEQPELEPKPCLTVLGKVRGHMVWIVWGNCCMQLFCGRVSFFLRKINK